MTPIETATLLLQQTRELIELTRKDDWAGFDKLQQRRNLLMDQFARLEVAAEEVEPLRTLLVEMRTLNQQLVEKADQKRDALLREKRALNKGRQMQNAYKG